VVREAVLVALLVATGAAAAPAAAAAPTAGKSLAGIQGTGFTVQHTGIRTGVLPAGIQGSG
jgi:hypothetical protein